MPALPLTLPPLLLLLTMLLPLLEGVEGRCGVVCVGVAREVLTAEEGLPLVALAPRGAEEAEEGVWMEAATGGDDTTPEKRVGVDTTCDRPLSISDTSKLCRRRLRCRAMVEMAAWYFVAMACPACVGLVARDAVGRQLGGLSAIFSLPWE